MTKTRFFQQITIASPVPEQSCRELEVLLAEQQNPFKLANVDIEVVAGDQPEAATQAAIESVTMHCRALAESGEHRGLNLKPAVGKAVDIAAKNATAAGITAVDHIVLMSNNADDCIRLFRDQLGMRLALDQRVPKWGGRMLFFREGSMTLEVIHNEKQPPEKDYFWGISYRCEDILATHAELIERGVDLSEVRSGRKAGTSVTSIKSHCAGIPSLLVGPSCENGNKS